MSTRRSAIVLSLAAFLAGATSVITLVRAAGDGKEVAPPDVRAAQDQVAAAHEKMALQFLNALPTKAM